jgi:hypothetical protein
MDKYLDLIGNAAALLGIAMCLAAGLLRIYGLFFVLGYQSMTIFTAGIGAMVFACLVKIHILVLRSQQPNGR